MNRPAPRFKDALAALARHGVDCIVVGGVAAVLAGAPISTFDLDIVPEQSTANLDRLLQALSELDARYRDPAGRVLRPERSGLAGPGHHLLMTTCGPVDVLGRIGNDRSYADLVSEAHERQVGGFSVRVLGLAALIRAKEEAGRDKDRAVLPLLRRVLAKQPQ